MRKSRGREGREVTMLVLIKLVRNEFPVSKHVRSKNSISLRLGEGSFPWVEKKADFEISDVSFTN